MLTTRSCHRFWHVGAAAAAITLLATACGGGSNGQTGNVVIPDGGAPTADAGGDGGSTIMSGDPSLELNASVASLRGGSAAVPGGQGQPGGLVHLMAKGDVTLDSSQESAVAASATGPAPPSGAQALTSDALGADVTASGTLVLTADVVVGGSDATRRITANGGDIFIDGTLRAADAGAARQSIVLTASGTVFILGAVDAGGARGGQAGGNISIVAAGVVMVGQLITSGGDGDATGGGAGSISIRTSGDTTLDGAVRMRGGSASGSGGAGAQAGAAGTLAIDVDGHLKIAGTIDGRGGKASGTGGGAAVGGAAGALKVGEAASPLDIVLAIPVTVVGGDGDAVGGAGGTVKMEPDTGNMNVGGPLAIDASGGTSRATPGAGGLVTGSGRRDPGTGGLHVSGDIVVSGGSIVLGGSGNGGDAGRVDFQLIPTAGGVVVDATGKITVDGGRSGGAGVAGGGGHVFMFTKDGDLTLSGTVFARGGDAPDAGGKGGMGGMVYFFTDNNHDAIHNTFGHLLIAPSGLIDASGGSGETGGSGRSDGIPFMVPVFPDHQEQISIFLNCDGAHGETLNWLDNQGHLVSRGGAHNGNGGDIVYHGISPDVAGKPHTGNSHPPSGNIDIAGDGTGLKGDFLGE